MRARYMWLILFGAILFSVVAADGAWAQSSDNALDRVTNLFRDGASKWEATLGRYALSLFWLLAGIEFAFAAAMLVFRNADFSEWLGELVKQILFIGFFLALLTNSSTWARAIVDSFRQAGASAGGVAKGIAPSDIFDVGMQVAGTFVSATSLWSPTASIGLFLAAGTVIVCFALITAFVIAALVESYIVISAGVLFMGFGGSRWTKDFAVKILVYAVSVGAKLFVLQLLIAIGAQIFQQLATDVQTSNESLFVIIGSAIVMLAVTRTVPEMVQGLINGASVGNGGAMVGTGMGAIGAGAATGMLLKGAGSLANAQSAEDKQNGVSWQERMARWPVRAAANVGKGVGAAMSNIGDRISGRAMHGGWAAAAGGQKLSGEASARKDALKEKKKDGEAKG